ncbi:MAG: hypothetical protein JOZ69_18085 [Myxococcales bacterium]|nr:hypothetical protein [Myxococcales bacterium]
MQLGRALMRFGRRVLLLAAALALAGACSAPAQPKGEGGPCLLVADCQAPLVCVPQSDGSRRCTSDTSSIVMVAAGGAPMDAAVPTSGAGALPDAGGPE